jgi:hypothetical protein
MPSKRILNANLKPQESKANKFKRQFEINRLMMTLTTQQRWLMAHHIVLRQGFVAIPGQPKQEKFFLK